MSQDLTRLPQISDLPTPKSIYATSQSLAMLDAILDPQGEFRYFSFDQYWGDHQAMAALRDGEGSHYFILFGKADDDEDTSEPSYAVGKLYDKSLGLATDTLDISAIGAIDDLSDTKGSKDIAPLQGFLNEEAFDNQDANLYFYQLADSAGWSATVDMKDISFLGFLAHQEAAYIPWASAYHESADDKHSEVEIDAQVVADIFAHKPLNKEMIHRLNPLVNIDQLIEDILDIGYPVDMG